VPTVLAWGGRINRILTSQSHVDHWVVIERAADGTFKLTIQRDQPPWAP
jgi:hypothetical protein